MGYEYKRLHLLFHSYFILHSNWWPVADLKFLSVNQNVTDTYV